MTDQASSRKTKGPTIRLCVRGKLTFDPTYKTYPKKGTADEVGAFCSFKVEAYYGAKSKPRKRVFQFITFDPDFAYLISSRYRKGHDIELEATPQDPYVKDGKEYERWKPIQITGEFIEAQGSEMGDEFYANTEGYDEGPPI